MPLAVAVVGRPAGEITVTLDRRWLMAYAAGVPDEDPALYDTAAGLVVHPLFPVAPEWQLVLQHRSHDSGLTPSEVRRGIHVGHDLVLHRPIVPDEEVRVAGRTVAVGSRRAGATQTVLFTATGADGDVVWRTLNTSLFLGVALDGEPHAEQLDWPTDAAHLTESNTTPIAVASSQVRPVDAHVYSECARIWNPIHTDVMAARAAGLDEPILHGTATLARAVSLAARLAGVALTAVRRVTGDFAAPVELRGAIAVRVLAQTERSLAFDVLTHTSTTAVRNGSIRW